MASLGLVFTCHLLLTRTLGAQAYGVYAYAFAWLNVLIVPATLASDRLVVRQVAVYQATGDWPSWRGLLDWSTRSVLQASLALALIGLGASWLLAGSGESRGAFSVAMLLLPILALVRLSQAALQGMRLPVRGYLAEGVVQPLILIALVAIWQVGNRGLSAAGAMGFTAVATCAALGCAALLLHRSVPRPVREAVPHRRAEAWSRAVLPLVAIGGLYAVSGQIPILMLGALGESEAAGILAVAKRLSDLMLLPTMAAGATLAPTLAALWAMRDRSGFQRTLTGFTRGVAVIAVGLATVLVIFRNPLLGAFGPPFAVGAGALVLLCIGQVVSALVGAVNLALVATDHEREAAIAAAGYVLVTVSLCAVLIPRWGIEGAAAASSASLILWNFVLAARVWRLLGIRPSVLAGAREAHGTD